MERDLFMVFTFLRSHAICSDISSRVAFHGSALGNWHCIFRQGLKNYSGTEKMSSGQAYGAGVYL